MSNQTKEKMKLLLIDDDRIYNAVMLRAATIAGVELDVCTSLSELGSVALLGRYDAVIVDYELEQMTGIEIAEYLAALFKDLPMILVSQRDHSPVDPKSWPPSIAAFISKSQGYQFVLEKAARVGAKTSRSALVTALSLWGKIPAWEEDELVHSCPVNGVDGGRIIETGRRKA